MEFSLGNILTIVLVVVILVIYRQLDRNNRSLDKVKRFSENIKKQLGDLVEERTSELKNLSIELEVHQKAAKEAFNRVKEAEESMQGRAEEINRVVDRIDEYDALLKELSEMTSRVDENLKRLQDESEFVDSVGRRLKETSGRIVQLEKTIPVMRDEFARQNSDQLKSIMKQVLKETDDQLQNITSTVKDNENMVNSFADYMTTMEAKKDVMEKEVLGEIREIYSTILEESQQEGEKLAIDIKRDLRGSLETTQAESEKLTERMTLHQEDLERSVSDAEDRLGEKLEAFQERLSKVEQDYHVRLKQVAERGKALEDEVFSGIKEHIQMRGREVKNELTALLNASHKQIEESRKELVTLFGDTRSEITVWQAKVQKQLDDSLINFDAKIVAMATGLEEKTEVIIEKARQIEEKNQKLMKELFSQLDAHSGELEGRVAEAAALVEKRIGEYEEETNYKLKRIDEINVDMDDLENNIRLAMGDVESRLMNGLKQFELSLQEQRKKIGDANENDSQKLRNAMAELEGELNQLKAQAYENVSEKLQIFEDDFFADIRTRDQTMQDNLAEWKNQIQGKLDSLQSEFLDERVAIEKGHNDQLKNTLSEFHTRTFEQVEKFEIQVQSFQDGIEGRMALAEQSFNGFEDTVRKELGEIKESAGFLFEKEFAAHKNFLQEQMIKFERETESKLKKYNEEIESSRKDFSVGLEASRSEVTVWQAQVLNKMKEAEAEVGEKFTSLKTELAATIGSLKDDFSSQREDLILETQEERNNLKNELRSIAEQVQTLNEELAQRTDAAMEQFGQDRDSFLLDFQKKIRDLQTEIDERIKDFRLSVQDTREKIDSVQKKLYGRIEENQKILEVNLQEIDKKQKSFLQQTKLFDRADSLQEALAQNIEDLRNEVSLVEAQSKELKEAEKKFLKIKKLGDEVSVKLTRFMAEKRQIEVMEGDFKKLINLSQAIDVKLSQVTGSHDELQAVQAELRNLQELEDNVNQKYERLEDKRKIVDSTIEGVEKNFENLQGLEKNVKLFERELASLPKKIEDAANRIDRLSQNKEKADTVMNMLTSIDELLQDLEERTTKMQSAREWLARTETRPQEVGKQAENQVKLLGSLLKEGSKSGKKGKSAPSMDARDAVTKLAHLGWSVKEIAQATHLSQGEVELILELLPK